jgi:hypothetical protein
VITNFKIQTSKSRKTSSAKPQPPNWHRGGGGFHEWVPRLMLGDIRTSALPLSDWSLNFEALLEFGF